VTETVEKNCLPGLTQIWKHWHHDFYSNKGLAEKRSNRNPQSMMSLLNRFIFPLFSILEWLYRVPLCTSPSKGVNYLCYCREKESPGDCVQVWMGD